MQPSGTENGIFASAGCSSSLDIFTRYDVGQEERLGWEVFGCWWGTLRAESLWILMLLYLPLLLPLPPTPLLLTQLKYTDRLGQTAQSRVTLAAVHFSFLWTITELTPEWASKVFDTNITMERWCLKKKKKKEELVRARESFDVSSKWYTAGFFKVYSQFGGRCFICKWPTQYLHVQERNTFILQ